LQTPDEKQIPLKNIPSDPGVYKFFNQSKALIYVGKAKNLKKRISSYFNEHSGVSLKTIRLVREIKSIDFIIVNTEYDALLLENNLIKENQPKFNILLKDDKSFPFICISNDRFPKIFSSRRPEKNEGTYFGPYTSVKAMNNVLDLIRNLYKVRTCNYLLSEKNISNRKFKICLEYHIGNCLGPCEGKQSEQDYLKEINQAKHIIKGNLKKVKDYFNIQMKAASSKTKFEEAQLFKNKLEMLKKFQSKTIIVNKKLHDIDVITISSDDKKAFINYMKVEHGMINISDSSTVNKKLDESDQFILQLITLRMREKFNSKSKTILCNMPFLTYDEHLLVSIPKIGDKKTLVELSFKNALIHRKEHINEQETKPNRQERILKQLQDDLKLTVIPKSIECFDNSNIQGTNPVASVVCFRDGKPSKKDYRHFKIKTVTGPDDFGSMKEIVHRRYHRLVTEEKPLPNLIVIDGGKGQLNAACDALKALGVYGNIPIIGIAKRLEELYYPEDSIPLHINKKSESLKLIQQLRDEAHRFAITFHRKLRSKTQVHSVLDQIKGIGNKTKKLLLQEYKSFKKIQEADFDSLSVLIGKVKAKNIQTFIKKKGLKAPS